MFLNGVLSLCIIELIPPVPFCNLSDGYKKNRKKKRERSFLNGFVLCRKLVAHERVDLKNYAHFRFRIFLLRLCVCLCVYVCVMGRNSGVKCPTVRSVSAPKVSRQKPEFDKR